jgi:hypothetical protein
MPFMFVPIGAEAIVALLVLAVILAVSPTGRKGRVKRKMRLYADNVFRERAGETPRAFDHWRVGCLVLGAGIVACMSFASIHMAIFDAEYPSRFTASGPEFERRSAEMADLVGGPSLLACILFFFLILAALGNLMFRYTSGVSLDKYAVEIGTAKIEMYTRLGLPATGPIDYPATAEKMGFSEKDIESLKKESMKISTIVIIVFIVLVCVLMIPVFMNAL